MYFFKTVSWSARGFTLVRCSFSSRASSADDQMFGEEETLLLSLLFRDREPSRPRVILPFSLMGTCIRDPEKTCMRVQDALGPAGKAGKTQSRQILYQHMGKYWIDICSYQTLISFLMSLYPAAHRVAFPISGSTQVWLVKMWLHLEMKNWSGLWTHCALRRLARLGCPILWVNAPLCACRENRAAQKSLGVGKGRRGRWGAWQ